MEKIDRFGFIRKADDERDIATPKSILDKEKSRTEKWKKMTQSSQNKYYIVRSRLFMRRVRKGIPDAMRAIAWMDFLGDVNEDDRKWATEIIKDSVEKLERSAQGQDALEAIRKDLTRTYPMHVKFRAEEGQQALFTVLAGYAVSDSEVGYCQGMSFVAAMFLMYANEVGALCLLNHVMNKPLWMMRNLYKPDMAAVNLRLYQYDKLLAKICRRVHHHFRKLNFEPSMYATQWFATVFTYNFPYVLVLRIWDIFLMDGWPIVMGVAVAFWRVHQKHVGRVRSLEQMFDYFRQILANMTDDLANQIMEDGNHLAKWYTSSKVLHALELDYAKEPKHTGPII